MNCERIVAAEDSVNLYCNVKYVAAGNLAGLDIHGA